MSAAQSRATCSRAAATGTVPSFLLSVNPSRRTCRIRNGAGFGAPTSREAVVSAATGRTTMRGSPSAAPSSTSWSRETSASSLRQLVPRVAWVVAVAAAAR